MIYLTRVNANMANNVDSDVDSDLDRKKVTFMLQ